MGYLFSDFNKNDLKSVGRQLKSDKIRITGIIERCKWDFPSIILLYPKRDSGKSNFGAGVMDHMSISTLLWLTCPFLNDRIHRLESDGYIKKISDFISSDRMFIKKMQHAHAQYFYFRKKVYRYFFGDVRSQDENSKLFNVGIGGITDIDNIKCLHIHYAHYRICNENLAGNIVYRLLNEEINCTDKICENDS